MRSVSPGWAAPCTIVPTTLASVLYRRARGLTRLVTLSESLVDGAVRYGLPRPEVGCFHGVSDEGVRLEHVMCIGYCGHGPTAMVDGAPVCEFTYISSLCTMRYRLDGWDDTIPIPRRPVAYMVAMQINALVEHEWQHGDLFHAAH